MTSSASSNPGSFPAGDDNTSTSHQFGAQTDSALHPLVTPSGEDGGAEVCKFGQLSKKLLTDGGEVRFSRRYFWEYVVQEAGVEVRAKAEDGYAGADDVLLPFLLLRSGQRASLRDGLEVRNREVGRTAPVHYHRLPAAQRVGPGYHITSRPFSAGGHEWVLKCFPDGDTPANADFISLFLVLQSGGVKTLSVRVVFALSKLEDTSYVAGDCLIIQCTVSVLQPPHSEDVPKIRLALPPSCELHRHLGQLLDGGEGADVTFQVGDEFFPAHRCVLAARSPVFRAELFGPMEEAHMQLIQIEDVEPAVFGALLRFIYTESLPPPMLEELVDANGPASIATARRLFAAADRYDVERLKSICEDKLPRDMDVDNVALIFELADRHHCSSLKEACVKFITASPETLFAVVKLHGWILQDDLVQKPLKKKKKIN
uniref:BTB domain-containing protein n=1 Tax=Ananas comosus var. bracteatus TaxID=296719 RepID=A0A6V7P6W5_ANACO|nr:unnamed protein product [Ananas comosus var. bracteatus]